MPPDYNIRAVERALNILDCFAVEQKTDFSLMEVAASTGLSPSTALRLLTTLENSNYIFRDPDNQRFYLGLKLAKISNLAFSNLDVCRVAQPFLQKLHNTFNESTGLYLLKGDRRVCIARLEGTQTLRSVVVIGNNQQLTRGASGRVLLAYLPEPRIRLLLEGDPFTNLIELESVRQKGYAVSYGEREVGVVSVAAPVFDCKNNAFSALFITGPESRFDDNLISRMVTEVVHCAREISLGMGYTPKDE